MNTFFYYLLLSQQIIGALILLGLLLEGLYLVWGRVLDRIADTKLIKKAFHETVFNEARKRSQGHPEPIVFLDNEGRRRDPNE